MSNYTKKAINPATGELEQADFLDDFYAPHEYAVRFKDGGTYKEEDVIKNNQYEENTIKE